jgi:ATP-dependent Clp protease protease subunit
MQPFVFEQTKDGDVIVDVFSRLARDRILFIAEDITSEVATTIVATLLFLDAQNKDPITIYISSDGGSVDAMLTILDAFEMVESPIHTCCFGSSASAATIILSAGDVRFILPNAKIMVHSMQISEMSGSAPEIEKETQRIIQMNNKILERLAINTGKSLDKIKKLCEHDYYFTAQEAIKFGLVDYIVKPKKNKLSKGKKKSRK